MPNRYEKLLIGTLIVTPVLIVASLISTLGINVAFLDEWDASAPLAIQAADGKLSLPFLFTQHNDHRIVPTKLTVVLSTWLTDWDSRFEMWVSVVLAALTFLLLLDILRSQENPKWLWLGVPLAWLVFSVRQAYNWLIGVQTAFLWFSSFSVLSVWLLMRLKVDWKALFGMALAAFAASWSLGGGLPLWIAMLPGLWLRGYRKWQYYATWLLVAGLCAWLYFNDFTLFGRELGREQTSLLNYFVYVLMFLGSPFVSERLESTSLAIFIGASGIGLFAWNVLRLWRSAPRQLMAAAFVLFLLSLTNAAMAAQGRAGYLAYSMTTQPLLSRYVTAANFLWIGLLLLVALNFLQSRQDSMGLVNALGFIVATLLYAVANFQTVLISSPASPLPSHENRACVLNVLFMRDRSCFEELYPPRPEIHITTAQRLAERRLNAFANWQADFPAAPQPAFAHVQPVLGVVGEESYRPRWISDAEGVALFQHPPSTAEQHLQLPDAPQVFFEAEIYVDLRNVREHPDVPQTGADFRLGIREGRQVRTLYEGGFDVNIETAPIPIRVDLSQWRGRAVVLVYETLVREGNPNFAWAMWRNPRLLPPPSQPAFAHVQPIGGVPDKIYGPRWITSDGKAALFQHPPSAAEQHLQLPDAPQVFFEAEIFVDLYGIRTRPDLPQTGADFRLGIREGRQVRTLYEGSFDVNIETAPIPIRVDLSQWRGRAVVLVYETLVREGNPNFAWAMWRNPRLVTQ